MLPEVTNYLIDWKEECHIKAILTKIEYSGAKSVLHIYTHRPGVMIGKAGNTIAKYQALICDNRRYGIDIIELHEVNDCIVGDKKIDVDAWYKAMAYEDIDNI